MLFVLQVAVDTAPKNGIGFKKLIITLALILAIGFGLFGIFKPLFNENDMLWHDYSMNIMIEAHSEAQQEESLTTTQPVEPRI